MVEIEISSFNFIFLLILKAVTFGNVYTLSYRGKVEVKHVVEVFR